MVEPWRHPDEGGEITPEMAAMQARAEEVFLAILARYTAAGRAVSHLKKGDYAPRLFAEEVEAKEGLEHPSRTWKVALTCPFTPSGCWVGKSKEQGGRPRNALEIEGGF